MGCILAKARISAQTDLVAFVNSDIVVFNSFGRAVDHCAKMYTHFAMIGQRTDSEVARTEIFKSFNSGREAHLEASTRCGSTLHDKWGLDYFVFRREDTPDIPEFVVGSWRWDNVLVTTFLARKDLIVVDATKVVVALHQNSPRRGYVSQ